MSKEFNQKLTFEEAYPAAVAKVISFVEKQKEIVSFEFAYMLNRTTIHKVKQGIYMTPPQRVVTKMDVEHPLEDFRSKEEISTGVSEAGDSEDRGSVSSDSQDFQAVSKYDAITRLEFTEVVADCVDQLRSYKSKVKQPICDQLVEAFADRCKELFELVLQPNKKSSRIPRRQAILACLVLAGKKTGMPTNIITDMISQHLKTEKALRQVIAVKRSKLFKSLVIKAKHKEYKGKETTIASQQLRWL